MENTISFEQLSEEAKYEHFMKRIEAGDKIEAEDWMPDDYRMTLIKLISMHGISEIMGALPEKEWVPKAPSLKRSWESWRRCRMKWAMASCCYGWPRI